MNSSYLILEFSHSDNLIPAMEKLAANAAVESCDAVLGRSGHANLALRTRPASEAALAEMLKLDGLKRSNLLPIAEGESFAPLPQTHAVRAYLFLDTVAGLKEAVRDAILALPGFLFCTRMAAQCDLTAMIEGDSIASLQQTIRERIQSLDGVLRLKSHYIFNLKEL